ncbi:MAG: ABC transporter permease [Alphaproteobacteria bacterium]
MKTHRYLLKRLGAAVVTLFGVSILIFVIARMVPGDPARIALGPHASKEAVEALRERLHLNEPLFVQYWEFLKGVTEGDFGISLYTNRPVLRDIVELLPATLELIFISTILMIFIGIPLGVLAARFRDGALDNIARLFSLLGVVTPSFVWAIFLMLIFAHFLGVLPVAGRLTPGVDPPPTITGLYLIDSLATGQWATFRDAVVHIILPGTALALAGIGQAARLTRANVAVSYDRQYIEQARAYGYNEFKVARKYVLRPALIPTLTILGLDIAVKLGNAFLVESVFAWPGMARYGVQTILHKDLNGIVGTVLVIATFFLLINIVIDLIVAYLEPRIRLGERAG